MNFPELKVKVCENISETIDKLGPEQEWSQPYWSTVERSIKSGCLQPCTTTQYGLRYSYTGIHDSADISAFLWFKNFKFKYEEEYIVCDWTCLIGEIGGNFGFFLGGSILALYDSLFHNTHLKFLHRAQI